MPVGNDARATAEVTNTWMAPDDGTEPPVPGAGIPDTGTDTLVLLGVVLVLIAAGVTLVAIKRRNVI